MSICWIAEPIEIEPFVSPRGHSNVVAELMILEKKCNILLSCHVTGMPEVFITSGGYNTPEVKEKICLSYVKAADTGAGGDRF